MPPKVLHLLSQRPSLTGSGVTLDALVRHAAEAGWEQQVVVGTPASAPEPAVGGLPQKRISPVLFGQGDLDFPLPGMSDIMPYPSSRWSDLDEEQIRRYRGAWTAHLSDLAAEFQPDVIHTHHLWLMSALVKDVWPDVPVVTHCHATGFRQMALCPHLAGQVKRDVRRNDHFVALHGGQAHTLSESLDISLQRVSVVGAGYRENVFYTRTPDDDVGTQDQLLYAGKLARAKGLPWLLDAVEHLSRRDPSVVLHVAGGGTGPESERIRNRMNELGASVRFHGRLDQQELASLMRRCAVFVLPSFYEGLPLVLVEALACGCRLVCTALPSVEGELAPHLGAALDLVQLPRLRDVDEPREEDLPQFVESLEGALSASLARSLLGEPEKHLPGVLEHFTWGSVFGRVERIWSDVRNC